MPTGPGFELDSKLLGPLPLVNHFIRRLRFEQFLRKHLLPSDHRAQLGAIPALGVLLRNLVVARVPLYSVGEWAREFAPSVLGLQAEQVRLLNDDRVGRALDQLFDADRSSLLTDLVVHMVREFDVALEQFHNDSTTLSLHGEYRGANGKLVRGKPTVVVTYGVSKDLRPDLKQLLWILTVSEDGAIPVHFKVADGNTEDSTTHLETWEVLRRLVGSAEFIYIADSKLCTRPNLKHIAGNGGWFITVLPRTRKEDKLFKDWLQRNGPVWEEVVRKPHPRLKDGPPDVFSACASPIPDGDGFRLLWFQSTHKMERDAQARRDAIQSASKALAQLQSKLTGPRPRFRGRAAIAKAVEKILEEKSAARWIEYEVTSTAEPRYRQEKRGRPGNATRWRRDLRTRFRLAFSQRADQVAYDARCDGVFPLLTNRNDLSFAQVLEAYKSKQPMIEKRHDLLKNVAAATPMYLKSISRIEALLFVHFVALMVHALIERQIRAAMETEKIPVLPMYPEERDCKAPSTARILEVFATLQRHLLYRRGSPIQRFDPDLGELQLTLLELLGVPREVYRGR